jgi:hypothetical protein
VIGIRLLREEGGQALAIAAAGAFVLAMALALTIDWGYALVQRRIAQNDADKIALEVGRLLTTSVALKNNEPYFAVAGKDASIKKQKPLTHVEACAAAVNAYQRDRSTPVTNPAIWLDFEKWSSDSSSAEPTSYVRANCAPKKPRTRSVDLGTTTVRVRVEFRYRPIFALLLGKPEVIVGATSRVALAGAPYTVDPVDRDTLAAQASLSQDDYADLAQSASAIARTWPFVRLYNVNDLSKKRPCGPQCDPTTATPLDFVTDGRLGSGVEILDLSSKSGRIPDADQLITKPEPGTSLADWFAEGFGGLLGLDTDWTPPVGPAGQNKAPSLANRGYCGSVPRWLTPPPSCNVGTRGDWIETITAPSIRDVVNGMHELMRSPKGTTTAYSNKQIPNAGGRTYGRALVVWIYLWDCGQRFRNNQWDDYSCASTADADRLHLFSVIPVTFYEGLVTESSIKGYWGGNFVDPGRCQSAPGSCQPLTPVANSAFLVADDKPWDPTDDGVNEGENDDDVDEGG